LRIDRGENQRGSAEEAVFARPQRFRGDVLHLSGGAVEASYLAAVDKVWIQRIRRNVAVLVDADRPPLAKGDLTVDSAAAHTGRTTLLLPAVNPVRKLVVTDDMIKLGRRLIVPRTPRFSAIHRYDGALIACSENDPRVIGIDPNRVI